MEIKSRKQLEFVLKADYMMNRGVYGPSFSSRIKHIISPDHIMLYLNAMRKVSYYKNDRRGFKRLLYSVQFLRYKRLGVKLGFSIGSDSLGYGVVIPHHGTIVIGNTNRIGNYAVLHTCTCITDNGKLIGDALYLATGAKITSQVTLGNGVSIGANSLVNKSCETDNVLLAGMPAKVIKETTTWYASNNYADRVNSVEEIRLKYGY